MFQPEKELYEFSRFRLDVGERLLLRDGKRVSLPDKAFDTLCVLVRHGGELVSKDELINKVWTDSIVEENNLDQKISMLRQALGGRGKTKEKFIETVRGHGFRFLPEVRYIAAENPPPKVESSDEGVQNFESESEYHAPKIKKPYKPEHDGNVVRLENWRQAAAKNLNESNAPEKRGIEENLPNNEKQIGSSESSKSANFIKQNKRVLIFIAALVVVVAVAVFVRLRFSDNPSKTNAAAINSIAVLPFVNESGSEENEYLSDGMTESLINSLSLLPNISVKARSSVFRYKGKETSARTIGNELSVQAVLLGRVTQRGDQLTLSLELVDARTENVVWSERYNRRQREIISLQNEIARDVSGKLRARLSGADEQRVTKNYTADAQAYEFYLQGLYHLNKRTPENIRKSIALFQQAIDKDPLYAQAYAWLAIAYAILSDYRQNLTKQEKKEIKLKMRAAAKRAQELDDSLAEVHALLATMHEDEWDFAAAENEHKRALELNPNLASAHHFYSVFLSWEGRHDEAFAEIYKAHELDPFSVSINFNIGARFFSSRRFDEAIAQFKKVLEMEPNHPLTHIVLAQAYDAKEMYQEAIAEYRTAWVLLEKESVENAARRADALTQALKTDGNQGYWQKRLEFSRKEYNQDYGSAYKIAVSYARLDERDRAFEQLEKSLAAREFDMVWIKSESAFDGLSSEPRFQDLLQRLGLPQ